MGTPVGHFLLGGVVYENQHDHRSWTFWKGVLFVLVFANLPDLDFLPGVSTGDPNTYHHMGTHSLMFALAAAGITALSARVVRVPDWKRLGILAGLLVCSHLLLDYFTIDTSAPYGMRLFWPFSKVYVHSPVAFLPYVEKAGSNAQFIPSLFCWHNVRAVLMETALISPILALLWMRNQLARVNRRRPA